MASTSLTFATRAEHRAWLESRSALPEGFRIGTCAFEFVPVEVPKPGRMRLTLIALDRPTPAFAAKFTRNAFPGAPVLVGRRRLDGAALGAVVINNKVANVCAPDGVEAAERVCAEAARLLGLAPEEVLPSSTGVIGWRLPVDRMVEALPAAAAALQGGSALPAAEAIMTTDLYPKLRRADVGGGSIVGFAKGAGMVEPNLATMLVYLLTDLDVPRDALRAALDRAVEGSFNRISVDSDTSTSDTVVLLSSRRRPAPPAAEFAAALARVCGDLAEDVVRNGEGVHHVVRVAVRGAPSDAVAHRVGKAVVNSPLLKAAVNGNDPNVGRLLCAVGKVAGAAGIALDPARAVMRVGGEVVLEGGAMRLDPEKERRLVAHMKAAELYASAPPADGVLFRPPIDHPPHERRVEIEIDLGMGAGACDVLGGDLSHEYVTENADYRS
ncbi:arginine biosynthesis bifunctional protein ArgJ [Anaeromyxobacter dehalogenans 2CP-1]|uniref:Arginine biosynthesis bifunctional protein ArgJ n=1 Tax=Anaeromyxobacter dehalogenans (strain ATCC BAA-258 / DSM 21875 / 2CP-1) TaxID=455488 RepID=B8JGF9_ANAD2|nr:bifunctional ornithine acetyltransferase/N-acetylglutamate synthase [Anaeromyxobacter dehalogenans]ACL64630.1 arginine biosynthesis bifunctional protein ArgJ [Anaeromyxobacter dehalogenans 2CP-1]